MIYLFTVCALYLITAVCAISTLRHAGCLYLVWMISHSSVIVNYVLVNIIIIIIIFVALAIIKIIQKTLFSFKQIWHVLLPSQFQTFSKSKSHKCTYRAIIHLIIIKNRFRCIILISEYLLPLLILGSLFISIVITSSSSSLPSHSSW